MVFMRRSKVIINNNFFFKKTTYFFFHYLIKTKNVRDNQSNMKMIKSVSLIT